MEYYIFYAKLVIYDLNNNFPKNNDPDNADLSIYPLPLKAGQEMIARGLYHDACCSANICDAEAAELLSKIYN